MIHAIHPNVRQYMTYVLDGREARNKLGVDTTFHFDQRPVRYAGHWQPLEVRFAKAAGVKKAAMPDLMIRHGRMFLNERARQALQGLLDPCGEWLPITHGREPGHLFNILAVADDVGGLDVKLCVKDGFGELQSLGFHEDCVKPYAVFRTAYDAYMGVYCQESFRNAVETAGLMGVTFSIDLSAEGPLDPGGNAPARH